MVTIQKGKIIKSEMRKREFLILTLYVAKSEIKLKQTH